MPHRSALAMIPTNEEGTPDHRLEWAMAPFHNYEYTERMDEFVQRTDATAEFRENWEKYRADHGISDATLEVPDARRSPNICDWSEINPHYYRRDRLYMTFEQYMRGKHSVRQGRTGRSIQATWGEDDKIVECFRLTNPNGHWCYWEQGGRYRRTLRADDSNETSMEASRLNLDRMVAEQRDRQGDVFRRWNDDYYYERRRAEGSPNARRRLKELVNSYGFFPEMNEESYLERYESPFWFAAIIDADRQWHYAPRFRTHTDDLDEAVTRHTEWAEFTRTKIHEAVANNHFLHAVDFST